MRKQIISFCLSLLCSASAAQAVTLVLNNQANGGYNESGGSISGTLNAVPAIRSNTNTDVSILEIDISNFAGGSIDSIAYDIFAMRNGRFAASDVGINNVGFAIGNQGANVSSFINSSNVLGTTSVPSSFHGIAKELNNVGAHYQTVGSCSAKMLFFFGMDPNVTNAPNTTYLDYVAANTLSFNFSLTAAQTTAIDALVATAISDGSNTIEMTLFTDTTQYPSGYSNNQIFDYSGNGLAGNNSFNFDLSDLQDCLDDLYAAGMGTNSLGVSLPTNIYTYYGLDENTTTLTSLSEVLGGNNTNDLRGQIYFGGALIPEPSAFLFTAIGFTALLFRRKRA